MDKTEWTHRKYLSISEILKKPDPYITKISGSIALLKRHSQKGNNFSTSKFAKVHPNADFLTHTLVPILIQWKFNLHRDPFFKIFFGWEVLHEHLNFSSLSNSQTQTQMKPLFISMYRIYYYNLSVLNVNLLLYSQAVVSVRQRTLLIKPTEWVRSKRLFS